MHRELGLQHVAVMMGANIATDIASDHYAETTVACADETVAQTVARLFDSQHLHTQVSNDVSTVEYCGALKNIVAVGAGKFSVLLSLFWCRIISSSDHSTDFQHQV